jgi:lipoate-protein ligase A
MKTTRGTTNAEHQDVRADYKVPGGKLLRVRMTLADEAGVPVIAAIILTGDFFMHPEEAVEDLEARLTGVPWEAEAVHAKVRAFFATSVEVVGAGVDDLVAVIMAATPPEA